MTTTITPITAPTTIIPPPDDDAAPPPPSLETSDCTVADEGLRLVPSDSLTENGVVLMAVATVCIVAGVMGGVKVTTAIKVAAVVL